VRRGSNANCITLNPAIPAQSPLAIIGTLIPAAHRPRNTLKTACRRLNHRRDRK